MAPDLNLNTMEAYHVISKGKDGWGIFYRTEDCLVFLTLFSVLVREMGLSVVAFSIMFNHTHALVENVSIPKLVLFQIRLAVTFVKNYNEEYKRTGSLFQVFVKHPKNTMKLFLSCVAYIFNNPVMGRLCHRPEENRWTLLAYRNNHYPFSRKIDRKYCRGRLRDALKIVDACCRKGEFLNYATLRRIFEDLTIMEKNQVEDYIISKYNFLDYTRLEELYGSFEECIIAVNATAGAEYDLEDEGGDHSCYRRMIAAAAKRGYKGANFETLPPAELGNLASYLLKTCKPSRKQLRRFLHLSVP